MEFLFSKKHNTVPVGFYVLYPVSSSSKTLFWFESEVLSPSQGYMIGTQLGGMYLEGLGIFGK